MKKGLILLVILVLYSPINAEGIECQKQSSKEYWGIWEGTLKGYTGNNLHESSTLDFEIRIVITRSKVKICVKKEGEWNHVKPGLFRIKVLDTNILISSMNSGITGGDHWIETWVINLTKLDDSSLMAYWQRVVNHPEMGLDQDNKYFSQASSGMLERIE